MAAEWLMFWDRNAGEIAPGPLRAIIKAVRKLLTDLGIEGGIAAGTTLTMGSVASGPTANAWLSGDLPDLELNLVLPKGDPGSGDTHTWGVVKQAAPLLIQLDGTVTQVGADTLVDGLVVDQRILAVRLGSELVVVGAQAGGPPVGSVIDFTGQTAPAGWLLCQGQAISRTTYARLFAVIGTGFGAGDGTATFNLPAAGRVAVGRDPVQAEFAAVGQSGGAKTHTLKTNEMPAHSHGLHPWEVIMSAGANSGYWGIPNGNSFILAKDDSDFANRMSGSAGQSQPHNNLQPYQVFNRIIKY